MRIKCPHCNGKGFLELNSAMNMTCGWCMGKGELDLEIVPTKSQTKQEWIQTATTEQLAKEIYKIAKDDFKELRKLFYGVANDDCDAIAMWLKQPHMPKE